MSPNVRHSSRISDTSAVRPSKRIVSGLPPLDSMLSRSWSMYMPWRNWSGPWRRMIGMDASTDSHLAGGFRDDFFVAAMGGE